MCVLVNWWWTKDGSGDREPSEPYKQGVISIFPHSFPPRIPEFIYKSVLNLIEHKFSIKIISGFIKLLPLPLFLFYPHEEGTTYWLINLFFFNYRGCTNSSIICGCDFLIQCSAMEGHKSFLIFNVIPLLIGSPIVIGLIFLGGGENKRQNLESNGRVYDLAMAAIVFIA